MRYTLEVNRPTSRRLWFCTIQEAAERAIEQLEVDASYPVKIEDMEGDKVIWEAEMGIEALRELLE